MSLFDGNVTSPSCGEYIITNGAGTDPDTLIIKRMINNVENIYEFEDVLEIEVALNDSYTLMIEDASVYSLTWQSDVADTVILVNTCPIDACMLQYVNKLVCCGDCLDCSGDCEGTEWLGKYIATDTMYVLLVDLINSHFGGTDITYPWIAENYDAIHTINQLLEKMEDLCSCTNCN